MMVEVGEGRHPAPPPSPPDSRGDDRSLGGLCHVDCLPFVRRDALVLKMQDKPRKRFIFFSFYSRLFEMQLNYRITDCAFDILIAIRSKCN